MERGKDSGRSDDQDVESIRNRFAEYNEKTAPLRKYYEVRGKFHIVNGIGPIPEITERLLQVISSLQEA
jgi:adenylate kinase